MFRQLIDGTEKETLTFQSLHYSGLSQTMAHVIDEGLNTAANLGPGLFRWGGKLLGFAKGSTKAFGLSRPATSSVSAKLLKDKLTALEIANANPVYTNIAKKIAKGHAFNKHVIKQREFIEISSKHQFENRILRVLQNPSEVKHLQRGRKAFWHNNTETLVIVDLQRYDAGTTFRPRSGYNYFKRDIK